jgi:hypothetical protein
MYTYKNKVFTYLGQKHPLLKEKINRIKEDEQGQVWVLTYKGIVIIDGNGVAKKAPFNLPELLNCRDIMFDSRKTLLATDKGVYEYVNESAAKLALHDIRHGLISSDVYRLANDPNGYWIGTGKGLCLVKRWETNTMPPIVHIASVLVNDSNCRQKNLEWDHNNMSFRVESSSYKDVPKFYYRLVGVDTGWHFTNLQEMSYRNLNPGIYSFQLRAANSDGIVSITPVEYGFIIQKPFWLTWWFILVEIAALIVVVYLIIQSRSRIIRKKEEEKTRVNKLIAEYQVIALRSQMNPHFIFNAINSIQRYVLEKDPKTAYFHLGKFSRLIRMVLNHSQDKNVMLGDELEMLRLYIDLEQLRFDNFECDVQVASDIDLHHTYIPGMLLQPFVENAIWHGLMNLKGSKVPKLSLEISKSNEELKISIEDNGVGRERTLKMEKDPMRKSLGMEITGQRIELINKLNKEHRAKKKITDLYDDKNNPAGTRVEIVLNLDTF